MSDFLVLTQSLFRMLFMIHYLYLSQQYSEDKPDYQHPFIRTDSMIMNQIKGTKSKELNEMNQSE